ncbi:MAG TPA: glycosyltransferase [Nitrospiraceae bacterium]|jgi:glycosyltransferase involved in cell wall biosynthesis|nr:glycosyltransferase [Nitrospiraceae bacterium]
MPFTTRVLVSAPYYLPGYRAGGTLRTIANMVHQLGDRIVFNIITRDRDAFMEIPYGNTQTEKWLTMGHAQVYYVKGERLSFSYWRNLISACHFDVLYLNSLFSFWFSIKPLVLSRFGLVRAPNVLLAPRGELSSGALGIKSSKKRLFLALAKQVGLYRHVTFQASSIHERRDIARVFGEHARIVVAADIPAPPSDLSGFESDKCPGFAKFAFLGRISPVKNLKGALTLLSQFSQRCRFEIFGPIDDVLYWDECKVIIRSMPQCVDVKYMGEVDNSNLAQVFLSCHYLVLPSLGENFGHAIYESLSHGMPVLISDQTPWRNLQAEGVGWDLALDNPMHWEDALSTCVKMTKSHYMAMREACVAYAKKYLDDSDLIQHNYNLLTSFNVKRDVS